MPVVIVSACQEISFAHAKGLGGGAEDGVRDTLSDLLASAHLALLGEYQGSASLHDPEVAHEICLL